MVYTVNEPWAPGFKPDADAAAAVLIGPEALQRLRLSGLQLTSHFWDVTRKAVENAGGVAIPQGRQPYWSEEDYKVMFKE